MFYRDILHNICGMLIHTFEILLVNIIRNKLFQRCNINGFNKITLQSNIPDPSGAVGDLSRSTVKFVVCVVRIKNINFKYLFLLLVWFHRKTVNIVLEHDKFDDAADMPEANITPWRLST